MSYVRALIPALFLLAVSAFAADTATVQDLRVSHSGTTIRVEIVLSTPEAPNVLTAVNPDRIVVELPETVSDARQRHIAVNQSGVRGVRMGLNSANPPVTRVVVDLDQMQQYSIATEGTKIVLTIGSVQAAKERPPVRANPPAAAASGPVVGIFRHKPDTPVNDASAAPQSPPLSPSPGGAPAWEPPHRTSTPENQQAIVRPSAKTPNRGSLQEGTVFPGSGVDANAASATQPVRVISDIPEVAVAGQLGATQTRTPQTPANAQNPNAIPEVATTRQLAEANKAAETAPPSAPSAPETAREQIAKTAPAEAQPSKPAVTTPPAQPVAPPLTPAPVEAAVVPPPSKPADKQASQPAAPVVSAPAPMPQAPTANEIPEVATTSQLRAQMEAAPALPAAAPPPPPAPAPVSEVKQAANAVPEVATTSELRAAQKDAQPAVSTPPATQVPAPAVAQAPAPVVVADASAPAPEPAAPAVPAVPLNPLIDMATRTQSDLTTSYKIKFVTPGAVYLEGGRNAGLAEGMKLMVRDDTIKAAENPDGSDPRIIAELEVSSVAETSAVTEIKNAKRDLTVGDLAWLSQEDQASLVQQRTLSATRKYPIVVSFTEGDPMDEEVRASVPRPPLPSVNRVRARIGLDYSSTVGKGFTSSQAGIVLRSDMTRIGGTYWNLSGYWRGRLNSSSSGTQQTLQDLINRTYQMNMTYDNPTSRWVMGFGRMYLPWATSLDTLDGGYFGARVKPNVIVGVFGGSTPDPTSWNYTPGRRTVGAFVNATGGSYESFRYFTTVGGAAATINGQFDRPFIFFENTLSYKRLVSFFSSVQADNPPGNQSVASPGAGLARAFLTARLQPRERVSFDVNYNYIRDVPTYNSSLVGTGLLDKYLFQGFSAGVRVEALKNVWVYTNLGSSSRTGDGKNSLNQMYGLTVSNIWHTGLSADTHYSKFDSAFGGGSYESLSLSRNLTEGAHIEVLLGRQLFTSTTTTNGATTSSANNSKFINALFDINFATHYFLQGGFTVNRGNLQNYNQFNFGVGYRFDNRDKRKH